MRFVRLIANFLSEQLRKTLGWSVWSSLRNCIFHYSTFRSYTLLLLARRETCLIRDVYRCYVRGNCDCSRISGYHVRRHRQCISTAGFTSWRCRGEDLFPEWIAPSQRLVEIWRRCLTLPTHSEIITDVLNMVSFWFSGVSPLKHYACFRTAVCFIMPTYIVISVGLPECYCS